MEFTINDQRYRLAKLGVFEQLKVSRKLLPLLAGLFAQLGGTNAMEEEGPGVAALTQALPGIAHAFAAMSDEDTDAILHPCLAVVSRQQGNQWAPVFSLGTLMFDDIDLLTLLKLVMRVVEDSLGNFLPERPASRMPVPPVD